MITLPRLSLLSFTLFLFLSIFTVSIRTNGAESLELLRRAQANDVDSQVNLAILKSLSGEVKEAHYWYRRAAKQNHPLASRMVGLNHFQGNGSSKNPNIGERWLERAARLGDEVAIEKLSTYCLEENRTKEAIAWQYFLQGIKFGYSLPAWINEYKDSQRLEAKELAENWDSQGKPPLYPTKIFIDNTPVYQELLLSNGDRYEGMTIKGIPNGSGKRISKDGSSYLGGFKDGMENGYGTWFDKRGIIKNQGIWKNGNPVFAPKQKN